MAPALSLSVSHLPVCKSQDFSKDTCLPKGTNRENPSAKIASDVKLSKRKLLSSTALGLIGGLSVAQPIQRSQLKAHQIECHIQDSCSTWTKVL
ncbi:Uncharacterized protein TCM_018562 [Theobroma cacao]|uniref:Uncharacterized protein n=1 Tax=Theobroma cacao TaxID=3641 RepID=A0A061EMC3_THECC|nr:Uncharacterized protein TCM_018562 [Theobroma cacao]